MLPPELEPRSEEELDTRTPTHGPAVRVTAIIVALALVMMTVGALLFTVFRPLPM